MSSLRPALLTRALTIWLPVAVLATIMAGLVYGVGQHILRSGANDPQVQMAHDAAASWDAGANPVSLIPSGRIDVGRSLAPFLIVFDSCGVEIASSAVLDGSSPRLPSGVFDSVRQAGEDRITWQPAQGVRIAAVIVPARQGFVLAGRSLRLVEEREGDTELLALLGWLAALGATAVAAFAVAWLQEPHRGASLP
jgi:hypothetical protein